MRLRTHTTVAIRFQTAVRRNGKRVRVSPWQSNLILDQGLDHAAVEQWCDCFKVAAAGTGKLVIKRKKAITFSRSGTTVTASASFFNAGDVDRLLKFDSGEEMYVTAFTDATHVTVGTSGTLASSPASLWYVNSIGLTDETKRTQTYSAEIGANSTIVTTDTLLFKRTFVFSAEVGTVTYREAGWSWTTNPSPGNIFGMAPLGGGTQTLEATEQLELTVQMSLVITPSVITPIANTGGAFDTAGNLMVESLGSAVSRVDTNGATILGNALEPSVAASWRVVQANWSQSTSIITSALGWSVSTSAVAMSLAAYVAGTFERALSGIFNPPQVNGTLYGFGMDSGSRTVSVKFTTPQTKLNTHKLTTVWKRTWQRALNNLTDEPEVDSSVQLLSAVLGANGVTWTFTFNGIVNVGAGGSAGWVPAMDGGAVSLAYATGSATTTLTYTGSRIVAPEETGTVYYTNPGDGLEDNAGEDVVVDYGAAVTNGSTTVVASLTEAASAADSVNAELLSSLAEAASAADTVSATAEHVASLSETAAATDTTAAIDNISTLDFTGSHTLMPVGVPPEVTGANITVEAWIYAASVSADRTVVEKPHTSHVAPFYIYALGTTAGAAGLVYMTISGTLQYAYGGSISANVWTHLAATYDGTTLRMYINGTEVDSTSVAGTVSSNATKDLYLGSHGNVSTEKFAGKVDEVRVWNVCRTQPEIAAGMTERMPGGTAGLVSCWHADENSGSTTADDTGNLSPASLTTGVTFQSASLPFS